jgi:TatD DNase family protein
MIDVHCHLEQDDYRKDRDMVITECKKQMKAVVTSCANPRYFDLTMSLTKKYPGFVFAAYSIHPEYVKDISQKGVGQFIRMLRESRDRMVAVGETGLDYFWTKDSRGRESQRELFRRFISLSRELKKPLVIHCRDAFEDTIEILEQESCREVLLHMFGGHHLLKRVVDNGWHVSLNAIVMRSKKHRKIARDIPLGRLMTETDSPWLAPDRGRNTPLTVGAVIKKLAEIRKIPPEEIDRATTENAVRFFSLPLRAI